MLYMYSRHYMLQCACADHLSRRRGDTVKKCVFVFVFTYVFQIWEVITAKSRGEFCKNRWCRFLQYNGKFGDSFNLAIWRI